MHFPQTFVGPTQIHQNVEPGASGKEISRAQKGMPQGGQGGASKRSHSLFPVSPQLSDKRDRQELRYSSLHLPPNKGI